MTTKDEIRTLARSLGLLHPGLFGGERRGQWCVRVSGSRDIVEIWLVVDRMRPSRMNPSRMVPGSVYVVDFECPLDVALAWLRLYHRSPLLARGWATVMHMYAVDRYRDRRPHPIPPGGSMFRPDEASP